MINHKNNIVFIHTMFWFYFIYSQNVKNGNWSISFELFKITFLIVSVLVFYLNYIYVLPSVFNKFNWVKLIVSQIFVFVVFGIFRYLLEQIITLWLFNEQNYYEGTTFLYIIYDNFHYGFTTVFASSNLFFIVHYIQINRIKDALEKEKKEAEINALKSQINPHFLFNTLNNIYALIQFNTNDALKAVKQLSVMMRFTTYESQKEKISIKQEVDFMKSLIELTKLSFPDIHFIKANFNEFIFSCKIEPYLLSPFLENALKHGEISDKYPIEIDLSKTENIIIFMIKNKISNKNKDKTVGIGLENIKKRLSYLYPNRHKLEININENYFVVDLKIEIHE
jgi:two-component system, LytTR family, sensor kinase